MIQLYNAQGMIVGNFLTIQDAVDASMEGYRVEIGSGTYNENVVVNVANLTINGPNDQTNSSGPRGPEADITGSITINAQDVTVAGLTITGATGNENSSIYVSAVGANIFNNVLDAHNADGVGVVVSGSGDINASGNAISGYSIGIYVNPGSATVSEVTGNEFTGNFDGLVFEAGPSVDAVNGNTFTDSSEADIRVALRTSGDTDLSSVIGANTFSGGEVQSVLVRSSGDSTVTGTMFDDRIEVATVGVYENLSDGVTFNGLGGNDLLIGGSGADILNGGDGNDILRGGDGADILNGGAGVDVLNGGGGNDTIDSVDASSNIFGGPVSQEGDTVNAGAGDDIVTAGRLDQLNGGAGFDRLNLNFGFNGPDPVTPVFLSLGADGSGVANDGTSIAGFEAVNFTLTDGADAVFTGNVQASLDGGGGNDILVTGSGDDQLFGGAGDDNLSAGSGDDLISGGTGNDIVNGGNGADNFIVNAQTDGSDTVDLGRGNDTVTVFGNVGFTGQVRLTFTSSEVGNNNGAESGAVTGQDGGLAVRFQLEDGNDGLVGPVSRYDDEGVTFIQGQQGLTFDVRDISGAARGDQFVGVALGTNGDDNMTFFPPFRANDPYYYNGGRGNDQITAGNANDFLVGGSGNDSLFAGDGNDTLVGGSGADVLNGGDGVDTASYAASAAGVTVFLDAGDGSSSASGGEADGDTLFSIENVIGSAQRDILIGNSAANVLTGGAGNDDIGGGGGDDSLLGGDGSDVLVGGTGADALNGGAGVDYAAYFSSATGVTVNLSTGVGSGGDATGDTLVDIEGVFGSNSADTLIGSALANELIGGDGDDTLIGLGGGDILVGGAGIDTASYSSSASEVSINLTNFSGAGGDAADDVLVGIENVTGSAFGDLIRGDGAANLLEGGGGGDVLIGEAGADRIIGGEGGDVLTGGADNDVFVFRQGDGADILTDFNQNGDDLIEFNGFGADFDFADLTLTSANNGVLVTGNNLNGSLFLQNTAIGQITSDDFSFV